MDQELFLLIPTAGRIIDLLGVAIILIGVIWAGVEFIVMSLRSGIHIDEINSPYKYFRQNLGKVILLGLEVIIAGDIIRSVATSPTFASVGILAILVLIRSFLSITLEMEVSGRWPWQKR